MLPAPNFPSNRFTPAVIDDVPVAPAPCTGLHFDWGITQEGGGGGLEAWEGGGVGIADQRRSEDAAQVRPLLPVQPGIQDETGTINNLLPPGRNPTSRERTGGGR